MGCAEVTLSFKSTKNKNYDQAHQFQVAAAVYQGNLNHVKKFINLGFDPNFRMPAFQLRTIAHLAAETGSIAILQFMIDLGASLNIKDSSDLTPIFLACSKGHLEVIDLLLKNNAKTSLKSSIDWTLKQYFCRAKAQKITKLFRSYKINI